MQAGDVTDGVVRQSLPVAAYLDWLAANAERLVGAFTEQVPGLLPPP